MGFDRSRGYFYGVLLGDGHINYTERALECALDKANRRGPMLMLKCCDYDMIAAWRDAIKDITGFDYKISKHSPGANSKGKRQQYKLRVADRNLVDEAETVTKHKTIIPEEIIGGAIDTKKSFIQGLMDSEGWINFHLDSLKYCDLTLGFACADTWFEDFYRLVNAMGIETSKIYNRKKTTKQNGEPSKQIRLFRLSIPDYVNAGLSFTIKRKRDRLAFCSQILNDYTRDYPKYEDYYRVDDIVWPNAKALD
jgi:hypothetical protein